MQSPYPANFARAWHLLARQSVIYCCLGIVDRASDIGNAVYEFALSDVFWWLQGHDLLQEQASKRKKD
jgi:hypothetical protein